MANDEAKIKQKIVLEGEKEYSSAIREANRNLKTLQSALKAETAELGKNATEQQKAQAKAKSLQKQIAEQEKVVKACRDALEEVRTKYGDNADAVAKYEQKLNTARATLGNMRNALEDVGDSFQEAGDDARQSNVEVKAFADAVSGIANAASAVSDTIGNLFSGMVNVVRTAITEVWGDLTELAARSNSWIDLAGFWNTSAAEIQKWAGAAGHASATLGDLSDIVTKINAAEPKKITELVGVSDANYEDDWKYAMAVMDALSKMEHQQRNAAGFEIFGGKQATKAFDLLNDWQTILDNLDRYDVDKGGIGMTEDEMQTMSDLADTINGIESTWRAFKDSFLAWVTGQLSLDLAGNAQGILDALIAFVDADSPEAQEEAIAALEQNITEFFTRIGEAIQAAAEGLRTAGEQMQESENGWVSTLGDVLVGLSNALEWFTKDENILAVKRGFELLAGVWAGGKVLAAVGTLSSLAANLQIIKGGGGILGALFAGGAAKTAATATATTTAAGGGLGTLLGAGAKAIAGAVAKATPWLAGLGVLAENAIKHQGNDDLVDQNGQLTQTARDLGYVKDANGGIDTNEGSAFHGSWSKRGEAQEYGDNGLALSEEQRAAAEAFWDAWRENPDDFSDESWEAFESAFTGMEDVFEALNDKLDEIVQGNYSETWRDTENIPEEVFSGFSSGLGKSSTSLDNASATLKGLPGQILQAVRSGVANIVVTIDGYAAGQVLTPYVSQNIARSIT